MNKMYNHRPLHMTLKFEITAPNQENTKFSLLACFLRRSHLLLKNNNNLLYTIVIYIPQKYDLNYLLGLFGRIFNIHVDIIELALGDIIELR